MKKEKSKKDKNKKTKDWNKILLITLLGALIFEVVLIPCLVYAEVKKILPIVLFLILPTLSGLAILFLSRNCLVDFENKKKRLIEKNNL